MTIAAILFAFPNVATAVSGNTLRGNVHSGSGQTAVPPSGAVVSIYYATDAAPQLFGTTTTDASGNFSLEVRRGQGSGGIY